MELQAQLAAQKPGPAGPELPARLHAALERACTRPAGLIIVSGPDAADTAAAFARQCNAAYAGETDTPAALAETVERAEGGIVFAAAAHRDTIAAIVALRRAARDRFALAAALRLVIAQRPAARLCQDCRMPVQAYGSMSALLGLDPGAILWSAEGCRSCGGTGEAGRIAIFEAVEIDSAMRRLIYDGADAPLLARHAFLSSPNLASAARSLAREGLVTAAEAVRISRG